MNMTPRELDFLLRRVDESFETLKEACIKIGEAGNELNTVLIVMKSMREKRT